MRGLLLKLAALAVIDAFAILLALSVGSSIGLFVGIGVVLVTIVLNVVFLDERLYPWRWMAPGTALLILMVVYPLLYTVEIAFTNYGGSHLLSKDQALDDLTNRYYKPQNS